MRFDRGSAGNRWDGKPVYLKDHLAHGAEEVESLVASSVSSDQFDLEYGRIFAGDESGKACPRPPARYSTGTALRPTCASLPISSILQSCPASLGHHRGTSSCGAGRLDNDRSHFARRQHSREFACRKVSGGAGVPPAEFNSFGARRGNHDVMMRGTFGNIRLRNLMTPQLEGPWTVHVPSGEQLSIFDARAATRTSGRPWS